MSNRVSNSSQRLKEMMDVLSLKQSDIVSRTGITKSALSNYLHGTREPRQDQISKIADPYKINPTWLMGYDAPMFMNETLNQLSLDNIENMLIETFRGASDEEKRMIIEMLAFFKSKKQDN